MDSDALLSFLVSGSQRWIAAQRVRYRPHSQPISDTERSLLASSFLPATLDAARVTRVPEIENPDFYAELGKIPLGKIPLGKTPLDKFSRDRVPMDFRSAAGITYGDTILVSESRVSGPTPIGLLFHELVHVVQYSILGIDEFARQYVMGWAQNGFDYSRIPLEVQAYALEQQFKEGDVRSGTVEEVLSERLARPN